MRTINLEGGSETTVSNGIVPEAEFSIQEGNPFLSGRCLTVFRPWRHLGMASMSVRAFQMASGGWSNWASRVTVWVFGSSHPISATRIKIPPRTVKIERIHFMTHLTKMAHQNPATPQAAHDPSFFVCYGLPSAHCPHAPEAPDRGSLLPAPRA